jgi:hypothetical protein
MEKEEYEVIYPTNINKYAGSIQLRSSGRYRVILRYISLDSTVDTLEEANELKIKYGKEKGKIKNIIHKYNDNEKGVYLKVLCEGDKFFLADVEDIDLINSQIWYVDKGYVRCLVEGKNFYFHNMKLDVVTSTNNEFTVDHINRIPYDNRSVNLDRGVSFRTQCINRGVRKTNKFGVKGISEASDGRIIVTIDDQNMQRLKKSFRISKYGYDEAVRLAIEQRRSWEQQIEVHRLVIERNKLHGVE